MSADDRYLLPSRRRSEETTREFCRLHRTLYADTELTTFGVGPEHRVARLRESVTGERPRMLGLLAQLEAKP